MAVNAGAGECYGRRETENLISDADAAGVTVTVSPQFFGWHAGIGKGIRISWPEDVREAYNQYLQGIVDCL